MLLRRARQAQYFQACFSLLWDRRGKKEGVYPISILIFFRFYDIILLKEEVTITNIEELRKKYINNPPEGLTSKDIRYMSGEELLNLDYFLNEDDLFDDEAGMEDF